MRHFILTIMSIAVCALSSGAQTLTATYVELADSADVYIRHERWADAERVIVKALRHEPANKSNYLLWSNLGTVRTNLGDYDGALQAFDIGLSSAPRSTILLSNRARALIAKGDNAKALADLDMALEIDSTLRWPRKMRGLLRATANNLKGASADFETFVRMFGKDSTVEEATGDISLHHGDLSSALTHYKEAYNIETNDQVLHKLLLTAIEAAKLEDYEEILGIGIRNHPRDGNLYLIRAYLKKNRYQTSDMEQDLKRAKELGADSNLYELLMDTRSKHHGGKR